MKMKNQVFIINGRAGIGKNTFVDFCGDFLDKRSIWTYDISSVDKVKEAGILLGWDGEKNEVGRQFLSDLKDVSTKLYDGPFKYMETFINNLEDEEVIFLHIREPKEISKVVEKYPHVKTIIIKSDRELETFKNHADNNVDNYPYDFTVYNHSDLDNFKNNAENFVRHIIMGEEK